MEMATATSSVQTQAQVPAPKKGSKKQQGEATEGGEFDQALGQSQTALVKKNGSEAVTGEAGSARGAMTGEAAAKLDPAQSAQVRIQPEAQALAAQAQEQAPQLASRSPAQPASVPAKQVPMQAQAQVQVKNLAQGEAKAAAPIGKSVDLAQAARAEAAKAEAVKAAGQSALMMQTAAERSPATQQAATSVNAGTTIAGLKPWSKDWVFQGDEQENPELRSLLEKSPMDPQMNPKMARMGSQLQGGAAMRGDASKSVGPKGQQAGQAQVAGEIPGLEEDLRARLMALGAAIDEINGEGGDEGGRLGQLGAMEGGPQASRTPPRAMSGDEFVAMLNQQGAARAASQISGQSGGQQLGQGAGRGSSQNFGQNLGQGQGGELKLVQGGKELRGRSPGAQAPEALWDPSGAAAGVNGAQHAAVLGKAGAVPMAEVAGHVVKGRMSQDRLSSEALVGVSGEIRNLTAQGGGEMRVRLRPDNLGELHVRVVTQGGQVGLHILASDDRAKKILEESMSHLKDSLASQNLTLGKVDVTLAQAAGAASADFGGQGQPGSNQNNGSSQAFDGMMRQDLGQGQGGGGGHAQSQDTEARARTTSNVPRSGLSSMSGLGVESTRPRAAAGRLDVRA